MEIRIRKNTPSHPHQKHWQFCVGSGHALLALPRGRNGRQRRGGSALGLRRCRRRAVRRAAYDGQMPKRQLLRRTLRQGSVAVRQMRDDLRRGSSLSKRKIRTLYRSGIVGRGVLDAPFCMTSCQSTLLTRSSPLKMLYIRLPPRGKLSR